jgi:DNA-binding winged helix-turn-helix (wHTH) protein
VLDRDGCDIPLPPKAIETLLVLVENYGHVVSQQTLMNRVWPGTFVTDSSLMRNISLLRKALDDDPSGTSCIETVSKRGYRFAMPVVEMSETSRPQRFSLARSRWAIVIAATLLIVLISGLAAMRRGAISPEARTAYLIGRHLIEKATPLETRKAREYFEEALRQDPKSSLAHAGLAQALIQMGGLGAGDPRELFPEARRLAEQAVILDPRQPLAHVAFAKARLLTDWDWRAAEASMRESVRLGDPSPAAHTSYGCFLSTLGRFDEARIQLHAAQALDPASPYIGTVAARNEYFAGRWKDAAAQFAAVLERESGYSLANYYLALTLGFQGRAQDAFRELNNARLQPERLRSETAWLQYREGRPDLAAAALEQKKRLIASGVGSRCDLLLLTATLNLKDEAFQSLNACFADHSTVVLNLNSDPRLQPLRADPRFDAALRRLGLEPR